MIKRFAALAATGAICAFCIITCRGRESPSNKATNLNVNVNVRIGVVMESGDVKRVARRDVLVTRANIVTLYINIQKDLAIRHSQIEPEIKVEIDYGAKLNAFQEARNKLHISSAKLLKPGYEQLRKHIEKTCQDAVAYKVIATQVGIDHYLCLNQSQLESISCREDLAVTYEFLLGRDLSPGAKEFLAKRYAELKEIRRLFPDPETVMNEEKRQLDAIDKEQREFMNEFDRKLSEKERISVEKSKNEFLQKFREALILSFKTDLNGEARVTMPKGNYFLFCDADIGLSHITWSYPIEVTQEGQSIELSNDNAFDMGAVEAARLISIIGDSK